MIAQAAERIFVFLLPLNEERKSCEWKAGIKSSLALLKNAVVNRRLDMRPLDELPCGLEFFGWMRWSRSM